MLLSMTGYARVSSQFMDKTITMEIKSVNSKQTEVRIKLPMNYKDKELEMRRIITERVERGKIELSVILEGNDVTSSTGLDVQMFKSYYQTLNQLCEELQASKEGLIASILRIPNIITGDNTEVPEDEWDAVLSTLNMTLEKFIEFRKAEGYSIFDDIQKRIELILLYLGEIKPYEEARIQKLREKLMTEILSVVPQDQLDRNRFEQEIIYYLEKMDITEEKVRLNQHCIYFLEQCKQQVISKGRTLNFISQEIGREINTLGAKANDSEIQKKVIMMKDELEKIKEQLANIV